MSDWDVNLIREFALRPIIYNKATPFFKNKYLTDCAWDEIAAKVGCDGKKGLSLYLSLTLSLSLNAHKQSFHFEWNEYFGLSIEPCFVYHAVTCS